MLEKLADRRKSIARRAMQVIFLALAALLGQAVLAWADAPANGDMVCVSGGKLAELNGTFTYDGTNGAYVKPSSLGGGALNSVMWFSQNNSWIIKEFDGSAFRVRYYAAGTGDKSDPALNGTASWLAVDAFYNPPPIVNQGSCLVTAAEIEIQRPAGNPLFSGVIDSLGATPQGFLTLTYTIDNTAGTDSLKVTGATAANYLNSNGFAVITTLPLQIAAGSKDTLRVSFNVDDIGGFNFDMRIANNDADENPFNINISGFAMPSASGQEIDVQGKNISITDGDSTPSTTDDTDFGSAAVDGGTVDHTFTIKNSGSADLNLSGTPQVAISGTHAGDFDVIAQPASPVAGGDSTTFLVRFDPSASGLRTATISIDNNDADENPYDIAISGTGTAWPPPEAIFYATPTMGCPELTVHFENQSQGMTNAWLWDFGDRTTSTEKNPVHIYNGPGQYTVSLIASNPAAKDTLVRREMICVYGYGPIRWSPLALVDNSFAYPNESWDNAIDGDVSGWEGTATVEGTPPLIIEGNPPFAIFEFQDKTVKPIDAVKLLTDTNVGFADRWVRNFRVMVSTTGIADGDFVTVLNGAKAGGGWQEFAFTKVLAKYIKLVIDSPKSGWRQIGEFQVCPSRQASDPLRSSMSATSPHLANGIDQSVITMTIRDSDGNLITGLQDEDFCLWANPEPNIFFPVVETTSPGVYTTQLASLYGGEKQFGAIVNGVSLRAVPVFFQSSKVTKASLQLIEGSETSNGEGWDNAIDGDANGWDGTVTAGGAQCYAIFQFTDGAIKAVQELRLLADTEVGYERRWVKRFRLLVSTTGLNDTDFRMVYEGLQKRGTWQNHVFPAANARYIKLIVDFPATGWRQVGEIEVFASDSPIFQSNSLPAVDQSAALEIPDNFSVGNNYPNPFNPSTQLDFALPEASPVQAAIYNTLGQKVRTLLDATLETGWHTVTWDGASDAGQQQPSGTYFFRIQAGNNSCIRKVQMLK